MASERNPDVVACDASILKGLWEIRTREQDLKLQQEEERIKKSALSSINMDWANRLRARQGNYKRVEKKPKPVDTQTDYENFWKGTQPIAPPLPRGAGLGSFGRPGVQSHKTTRRQDKSVNRLQLLLYIAESEPSAMVWGKSWKYNKRLPPPAEAQSDWGQCWVFATQQPHSEAGKPWPNGPNMKDPLSLRLWKNPDCRPVETRELDVSAPAERWQMSWRKSNGSSKKEPSSVNEDKLTRYFTLLLESQHHDRSSEWRDSWRATKAAGPQDHVPHEALIKASATDRPDQQWDECWRMSNLRGGSEPTLPQIPSSRSPEWENSWRATAVSDTPEISDHSLRPDDVCDESTWQKQSFPHRIMIESNEHKHKDVDLQLHYEFITFSEWSKSWQVTKNNSQPSEEIETVLKTLAPKMEEPEGRSSTSEGADLYDELLKHDAIYEPKRGVTQSKRHSLRCVETFSFSSNWTDSWKTLKHRTEAERRRLRPDPLRPFRESEDRDTRSAASEWKDSWRYRCLPLRQEQELWQRGWAVTPQFRVDRARGQEHFAPVELPKNGPTAERSWGESWRSTRRQQRSRCGQRSSSSACYPPDHSGPQRRSHGARSDWRASWMVSDSRFHHDTPSLTQWREAWRCSAFHTDNWAEQGSTESCVNAVLEIQPMKEKMTMQKAEAKMSWTLDDRMFRERYPEKQWSTSWRAESFLSHQTSCPRSSGEPARSTSSTTQPPQAAAAEDGAKWGRCFRLANPMPLVEKPWLESSPNRRHHTVLWSRGNGSKNNIYAHLHSNPTMYRLWRSSFLFLQEPVSQIKLKSKSEELVDPRVIITRKIQTRRHLISGIDCHNESEKKSPGGHLIGKTQPRPKRVPASEKRVTVEDETKDKFFEDWAESWRSMDLPGGLRKLMSMRTPSGWAESWKFLLPLYQTTSAPKAK